MSVNTHLSDGQPWHAYVKKINHNALRGLTSVRHIFILLVYHLDNTFVHLCLKLSTSWSNLYFPEILFHTLTKYLSIIRIRYCCFAFAIENYKILRNITYRYNVQGPTNLRCWLGEWAVTSMPECVAGKKILSDTKSRYLYICTLYTYTYVTERLFHFIKCR